MPRMDEWTRSRLRSSTLKAMSLAQFGSAVAHVGLDAHEAGQRAKCGFYSVGDQVDAGEEIGLKDDGRTPKGLMAVSSG